MNTLTLLAAVLSAGAIVGAGFAALSATHSVPQDDGSGTGGPGDPQTGEPDYGDQNPPQLEVAWSRSGADILVTFTLVDEPKLLDCRWSAGAQMGDEQYFAWTNFTDPEAWSETSRHYGMCVDPKLGGNPQWPLEPRGMSLTDADGDHMLSMGDYLTIRDVTPGDEARLNLVMAYWGAWLYTFHWQESVGTGPTI